MKYSARGGEGPREEATLYTASHDFEVLHDVDWGGSEGRRRPGGRKIDSAAASVFYHHFRVLGEGRRGEEAHARKTKTKRPLPPPPRGFISIMYRDSSRENCTRFRIIGRRFSSLNISERAAKPKKYFGEKKYFYLWQEHGNYCTG